jgi:hypothetical protein
MPGKEQTHMPVPSQVAIERFQRLEIDVPTFGHREHIEVAYYMLEHYEFIEACYRYASTIRAIAQKHGAPQKYNTTITLGFLSLIAEAKSKTPSCDLEGFLRANPKLLEKDLLGNWYSAERLSSQTARELFVLPELGTQNAKNH